MSRQSLETHDDAVLLSAFAQGDSVAFEVLLARHQRPVFNFLLRSVRDQARAEDLLQEVFLRVIQNADQFQRNAKFTTWLYAIARNLCVDHARRMTHRRHASLDVGSTGEDAAPMHERVASAAPTTEELAAAPSLREKIALAVEALPEEQREVFLLRQLQGLPFSAIASVVGVSENTVKSRMRYALERLQQALSPYEAHVNPVD